MGGDHPSFSSTAWPALSDLEAQATRRDADPDATWDFQGHLWRAFGVDRPSPSLAQLSQAAEIRKPVTACRAAWEQLERGLTNEEEADSVRPVYKLV